MLKRPALILCSALLSLSLQGAAAQDKAAAPAPQYDGELAKSLGADAMGMRGYVLVILKTGPKKMEDPEARNKMFQGHMANIQRLALEKKLVLAGPLDGVEGRRGICVLNTADIEVAKSYVATDPMIINGEMVAEFHKFYGSAALMMVNDVHAKIQKQPF